MSLGELFFTVVAIGMVLGLQHLGTELIYYCGVEGTFYSLKLFEGFLLCCT